MRIRNKQDFFCQIRLFSVIASLYADENANPVFAAQVYNNTIMSPIHPLFHRLYVLSACSSSRSGTSRTRTDSCRPETAATSRPVGGSSAVRPETNVTPSSTPVSRSTRPGSFQREPAPLGQGARGSWVGTPCCCNTMDTMEEEEEERKTLMDKLSFPSNTPGQ